MSVTFCMMIPFRKKNTLSAYRSQGGGDHLIKRTFLASVFFTEWRETELTFQRFAQFFTHGIDNTFYDAWVTGNHVARHIMVMAANKVGHHAARFTNQQFATREIPRFQTDFEETVNAACGHGSQRIRQTVCRGYSCSCLRVASL